MIHLNARLVALKSHTPKYWAISTKPDADCNVDKVLHQPCDTAANSVWVDQQVYYALY